MNLNVPEYAKILEENNISIMYNGPISADGIAGLAGVVQQRLNLDTMLLDVSKSVFSVFLNLMDHILFYSTDKETYEYKDGIKEVSKGVFIMGVKGKNHFIYTGNLLEDKNVEILKEQIDYLNKLDKVGLRQYYKKCVKASNYTRNKSAELGLIEIARRASSKIAYEFQPRGNGMKYFIMYVEI